MCKHCKCEFPEKCSVQDVAPLEFCCVGCLYYEYISEDESLCINPNHNKNQELEINQISE